MSNENENFERLGKYFNERMYDVKKKIFLEVEVELVRLSNGRYAVVGVNPDTGMKMTKLFKTASAKELLGEVTI